MKLAYMYAASDVGPHQVTAIRGDLEPTLKKIRETGYSGVEFLVRDPSVLEHKRIVAAVDAAGLDVSAVCTGEVYGEDGLSFADPDPTRREIAIERMLASMELAAHFDAPVNIGRLHGRYCDEVPNTQTLDWIAYAISLCADRFPDGRIVLEPVNREYANCLMTTAESLQFIKGIGCANVGLMLDSVHMLVEGEDLLQSMRLAKDYFWHFHISDSGRLPVGAGEYEIEPIFEALNGIGYDRYVTIETFQVPDGETSLQTSYRTLVPYFEAGR